MNRLTLIVIVLLALSGCASDETSRPDAGDQLSPESTRPSPLSRTTGTSNAVWTGEVLPDSTWTKTLTVEQAQEVGVDRSEIPPNFGEDGLMPLTFVLESDSWAIMVGNDQGMNEPGDIGTFTYDDHGRLVTTSHSEGCPGCVVTLRWRVAQDELTIAMVEKTGDPLEELILSGQWERVS